LTDGSRYGGAESGRDVDDVWDAPRWSSNGPIPADPVRSPGIWGEYNNHRASVDNERYLGVLQTHIHASESCDDRTVPFPTAVAAKGRCSFPRFLWPRSPCDVGAAPPGQPTTERESNIVCTVPSSLPSTEQFYLSHSCSLSLPTSIPPRIHVVLDLDPAFLGNLPTQPRAPTTFPRDAHPPHVATRTLP